MIRFPCPHCGTNLKAPDGSEGKTANCRCGRMVTVQAPIVDPESVAAEVFGATSSETPARLELDLSSRNESKAETQGTSSASAPTKSPSQQRKSRRWIVYSSLAAIGVFLWLWYTSIYAAPLRADGSEITVWGFVDYTQVLPDGVMVYFDKSNNLAVGFPAGIDNGFVFRRGGIPGSISVLWREGSLMIVRGRAVRLGDGILIGPAKLLW